MEPIIAVNNLVKRYKKADKPAVGGISFEVKQGEFFAFLGPNGAGKTTTISILTTTLSKTEGQVTIAGYDIEREAAEVRRNVGIIFQNPSLDLDLTAEENIRLHVSIYGIYGYRPLYRMMPAEYRQRIHELAEVVGLQDQLFKKVKGFSGGMKRKLEIMRSLMHNPRILFLDEPTQGLDASARQSIWTYLKQLRKEQKITVFLTTHYLEEAEEADRVCMVTGGKISALGTPDEIKRQLAGPGMMVLASDDIETLKNELTLLNAPFVEEPGGLRITCWEGQAQKIVAGLKSPLTKLDIRQPTLEEAYLSLVTGKGGVSA
ncbi:ABC transporter ATP-binding protein [Paenibacillus ginsengarvi]|uniref:ABC transporter ATP-binding protein n=1 Tax=Paenibacillus ginsengarvi TaxID=400777 RepID=A0A3B0CU80_9BACL|nr:ABC transporter ATP-binding protein [Paenibacillus ginsengarvi]RKN86597.1 ABC transporter ATP-binding protein [Paenibacillus ginsengarvi]